ncbi:hypothetical protein DFH28DRAFT_891553 [Melampsora americana]|nr:hypothetical protein DFH28DRAFT_891553 [Melampsora americana]
MGYHFHLLYLGFMTYSAVASPSFLKTLFKQKASSHTVPGPMGPMISKKIEVYEPYKHQLNPHLSLESSSSGFKTDSQPTLQSSSMEYFMKYTDMKNQIVASEVEHHLETKLAKDLKRLELKIHKPTSDSPEKFNPSVFYRWAEFEHALISAVETLENHDDLDTKETIWALAVLKNLQGHLPEGQLEPIRTDMAHGPICRAALGISLTKDVDLLSVSQILWSSHKEPELVNVNLSMAKAYFLFEAIGILHVHLQYPNGSVFFKTCVEIYNYLLTRDILMDQSKVEVLGRMFLKLANIGNPNQRDIGYFHLYKMAVLFPDILDMIEKEKLMNASFKTAYNKKVLNIIFTEGNKELLQDISNFLIEHDCSQIEDMFDRFQDPRRSTVQDVERVVNYMVKGDKPKGLNGSLKQTAEEQHEIISLLDRIAIHIPKAKEYLESQVEWSSK